MLRLKRFPVIIFFWMMLIQSPAIAQIRFEENLGQWNTEILFKADIPNGRMYVMKDGLYFDLFTMPHHLDTLAGRDPEERRAFRLKFINSSPDVQISQDGCGSDYSNYYLGNNPAKWKSHVRNFTAISIRNLYPGIDFLLEGGDHLKTEYHIHPGANPNQIQLLVEGSASPVLIDSMLHFQNPLNTLMELKPFAYQVIGQNDTTQVSCSYQLKKNKIRYSVESFDKNATLVIDPYLVFSTYSGSLSDNWGFTACFDDASNAFSGGITSGAYFPYTSGAFDTSYNATSNWDIALIKYDSLGINRLWATYLGGDLSEMPHSMIADANDNLIVFGTTGSPNFPVPSTGYDPTFNGGTALNYLNIHFNEGIDMFLFKLSSDGTSMLGATFIGGSQNDGINYRDTYSPFDYVGNGALYYNYGDGARGEVIVDASGKIYIGSCTFSDNYPVSNSFQNASNGLQEGVLSCFSSNLTAMLWSSYLGGTGDEAIYSLDIDPSGAILFAGGSASPDLPVTDSVFTSSNLGGTADGFIGKIDPSGSSLLNLLRYGSVNYDQIYFVKTDASGSIYFTGQTCAPGATLIANASYNNPNSGQFIAKISSDFKTLDWSTVFGLGDGNPDIALTAFAVDLNDRIYLCGWGREGLLNSATSWANFQGIKDMDVTPGAFQTYSDGQDFYLMILSDDGNCLKYATFFGEYHYSGCTASGRDHVDGGTSRFDKRGYIYQSVCASCGGCDHFPVHPAGLAWSEQNNSSNCNNAVFKFELESAAYLPTRYLCNHQPVQLGPAAISSTATYTWKPASLVSNSSLPNPFTSGILTDTTLTLFILDGACLDSVFQRVIPENVSYLLPDSLSGCESDTFSLDAAPIEGSGDILWSLNPDFSQPFGLNQSQTSLSLTNSATVYFLADAGHCSYEDSIYLFINNLATGLEDTAHICLGDTIAVELIDYPNQELHYDWTPDSVIISGEGSTSASLLISSSQWVYIDVTNDNCFNRDSIWIDISYLSQFDDELIDNETDTIYETQQVQIQAQNLYQMQYFWQPAGSLSDSSAVNVMASPLLSTTYNLIVKDEFGCFQEDSIRIIVLDVLCDESHIYVPNGFSPNNDQKNDVLYVRTEMSNSIHFAIYSRLGEKVFETKDPSKGWDGTFHGKQLEPAVFVYYLQVSCWDGSVYESKGNITLIR